MVCVRIHIIMIHFFEWFVKDYFVLFMERKTVCMTRYRGILFLIWKTKVAWEVRFYEIVYKGFFQDFLSSDWKLREKEFLIQEY